MYRPAGTLLRPRPGLSLRRGYTAPALNEPTPTSQGQGHGGIFSAPTTVSPYLPPSPSPVTTNTPIVPPALLAANNRERLIFVRPWDGVATIAHAFAIVRAVEAKYGEVDEMYMARDPETSLPSSYFFLSFRSPASAEHVGISTHFEVPLPRVDPSRPGGIGMDDLHGLLGRPFAGEAADADPSGDAGEPAPSHSDDPAPTPARTLDVRLERAKTLSPLSGSPSSLDLYPYPLAYAPPPATATASTHTPPPSHAGSNTTRYPGKEPPRGGNRRVHRFAALELWRGVERWGGFAPPPPPPPPPAPAPTSAETESAAVPASPAPNRQAERTPPEPPAETAPTPLQAVLAAYKARAAELGWDVSGAHVSAHAVERDRAAAEGAGAGAGQLPEAVALGLKTSASGSTPSPTPTTHTTPTPTTIPTTAPTAGAPGAPGAPVPGAPGALHLQPPLISLGLPGFAKPAEPKLTARERRALAARIAKLEREVGERAVREREAGAGPGAAGGAQVQVQPQQTPAPAQAATPAAAPKPLKPAQRISAVGRADTVHEAALAAERAPASASAPSEANGEAGKEATDAQAGAPEGTEGAAGQAQTGEGKEGQTAGLTGKIMSLFGRK